MFWVGLFTGIGIYIVIVGVMAVVGIIKNKKKGGSEEDVRD